MRSRDRLVEALTGRFDEHHGELARVLLDQIDSLTAHIDQITGRVGEPIDAMPGAWGVDADGVTGPGAGLDIGRLMRRPLQDAPDAEAGMRLAAAQGVTGDRIHLP